MSMRRTVGRMAAVLLLGGCLLPAVACASPRGRMYVRVGPPAPIVESRLVAPGPGYLWLPGYYSWDGRGYGWVPGRWDRAPTARASWVPAHWVRTRRGWYLVEGRWR